MSALLMLTICPTVDTRVRLAAAGRRARHRGAFEQAGPINVLPDVRIVHGAAAEPLRREQARIVAEVVEWICSARRSQTR
jgi:hypothetical protein